MVIPKKKHSKNGFTWAAWNTRKEAWASLPWEYSRKKDCIKAIRYYRKEA